ncbi:ATP synthase subunit I [Tissierellia bacterium S5-A11]|nr:ATP synthase subunit I [Tissierellia bacterium S5-A11]
MAIVKMKKFRLFSFKEKRRQLLDELQNFEDVYLIESKSEKEDLTYNREDIVSTDAAIHQVKFIIDFLEGYQEEKPKLRELIDGNKTLSLEEIRQRAQIFPYQDHYEEVLDIYHRIEDGHMAIEKISGHIEELKPWEKLPVAPGDLDKFTRVKAITGQVPSRYYQEFEKKILDLDYVYLDRVYQDKDYSYYLVVVEKSQEKEAADLFKRLGFSSVDLKVKGRVRDMIQRSQDLIEKRDQEIHLAEEDAHKMTVYLEDFQVYHDYLKNERFKLASSEKFLTTKNMDLIEGYVPSPALADFEDRVQKILGQDYYLLTQDADRDSQEVPILLKNNRLVKPFELLTSMYAYPKYNEIDPTPFFAPFYFLFAGIMVGDLGYGLLVFIGTLLALKCFNLDKGKRQFIQFFNYLSISTMIWGLIFGSFLGGIVPLPSLIDPANQVMEMVLLSMVLGGIHLFFGLGLQAYMDIRDHKPLDALYDVGFWYMTLVGAIGTGISKVLTIQPLVAKILFVTMIIGMVGILLTGGRAEKSIGGKIGWGVYSLYGLANYIGDFASYFRLMALVLSGSFIAVAVNMISGILFGKGILGILFGLVIFLVFQLFNAFLSYLSAYVHTARLTYVEMFNKFYEGGGHPFRKFVEDSEYFNVK